MQKFFVSGILVFCVVACGNGTSERCPSNAPLFTEALGTELINNWGNQVSSYSPGGSAGFTDVHVSAAYFTGNNYLPDAVLLPTVSPMTRDTSQEIYDYFTHFLADQPTMTNNPGTPQAGGPFLTLGGCGYGVISGYYNFVFGHTGDGEPTNARYTFQFQYLTSPSTVSIQVPGQLIEINQPAGWYIMLQNSAKLP